MRPYLEQHFGNPSSAHAFGRIAHDAVEQARDQVAALLNAHAREILFTSGGTESNNHVLRALLKPGAHVVTSAVEHPAILAPAATLEKNGVHVTRLPVDHHGRVSVDDVASALRPETALVTIMHANNEVGTVQPIAAIAELTRPRGIALHTDAAQSIGKIPVDVDALGVDLLTVAGHKLYAPKGIGALYIRRGIALERFMEGAGQEHGRRAGTENVMMIAGLGAACAFLQRRHDLHPLRDLLEQTLLERVPGARVNGHPEERLPNTSSISFPGAIANELLARLDGRVAASAGAACHSGETKLSHVLRAMGVTEEEGRGTIRFSTGRFTTAAEIGQAVEHVVEALRA